MTTLEQMLVLLAQGGIFTLPALAGQLGLGVELAQTMVAMLTRQGYLSTAPACDITCHGRGGSCQTDCTTHGLLALSAKGQAAAKSLIDTRH